MGWSLIPGTRSAEDALLQSISQELGADGAYFLVHHFAPQLASPFPLLAAIGARSLRIEVGTAVIDMRHQNPPYLSARRTRAAMISYHEPHAHSGVGPEQPHLAESIAAPLHAPRTD